MHIALRYKRVKEPKEPFLFFLTVCTFHRFFPFFLFVLTVCTSHCDTNETIFIRLDCMHIALRYKRVKQPKEPIKIRQQNDQSLRFPNRFCNNPKNNIRIRTGNENKKRRSFLRFLYKKIPCRNFPKNNCRTDIRNKTENILVHKNIASHLRWRWNVIWRRPNLIPKMRQKVVDRSSNRIWSQIFREGDWT